MFVNYQFYIQGVYKMTVQHPTTYSWGKTWVSKVKSQMPKNNILFIFLLYEQNLISGKLRKFPNRVVALLGKTTRNYSVGEDHIHTKNFWLKKMDSAISSSSFLKISSIFNLPAQNIFNIHGYWIHHVFNAPYKNRQVEQNPVPTIGASI